MMRCIALLVLSFVAVQALPDQSTTYRMTRAALLGNPAQRRQLVAEKQRRTLIELVGVENVKPVVEQKSPRRSEKALRRATKAAVRGSPAQRRTIRA